MATTITVDDTTLERFKKLKQELDDAQATPNHTADSFLSCLMDTYEAVEDGHYGEPNDPLTLSEVDEIADQLKEQIGNLAFQGVLLEDEADRIIKRIDDLESRLPRKVAKELQ